jgi:hypothetical protein
VHLDPVNTIVNVGYALMLLGFIVRDVLILRSALMAGQICVVTYACANHRIPVAFWNGLFACINCLWVAKIIHERRPAKIPADIKDLYEKTFAALSPKEFLAFWKNGSVKAWGNGRVVREGDSPADIFLVLEGSAHVEHKGRILTSLPRGRFFAEMSFLTGQTASADIRGDGALKTIAWPQQHLRDLKSSKPALFLKLQGILGCDLAAKLRDANDAARGTGG